MGPPLHGLCFDAVLGRNLGAGAGADVDRRTVVVPLDADGRVACRPTGSDALVLRGAAMQRCLEWDARGKKPGVNIKVCLGANAFRLCDVLATLAASPSYPPGLRRAWWEPGSAPRVQAPDDASAAAEAELAAGASSAEPRPQDDVEAAATLVEAGKRAFVDASSSPGRCKMHVAKERLVAVVRRFFPNDAAALRRAEAVEVALLHGRDYAFYEDGELLAKSRVGAARALVGDEQWDALPDLEDALKMLGKRYGYRSGFPPLEDAPPKRRRESVVSSGGAQSEDDRRVVSTAGARPEDRRAVVSTGTQTDDGDAVCEAQTATAETIVRVALDLTLPRAMAARLPPDARRHAELLRDIFASSLSKAASLYT